MCKESRATFWGMEKTLNEVLDLTFRTRGYNGNSALGAERGGFNDPQTELLAANVSSA